MTFRLKGGPELLQLLDQLPKNLERNVIRGGLRAGAKVIQQQAKANVPVKTGQLKRAIGIGTRTDGAKLSSYVKLRGKGSYLGTVAGVILITLLQSILSVMQIDEAGRQLIFGAVIEQVPTGATAEWYTRMGGSDQIMDAYRASLLAMAGMTAALYAVQVMLRLRAEEAGVAD